jgi:nifR3 family TIM-barrel protein
MANPTSTPVFYVDNIPVFGDLILSPMEGFSDLPFRSLCRSLGSAMSYSEFINAMDIVQDNPNIKKKLAFFPEESPVVFQIFDNDAQRMLEAALRLQELGPDIIDINMGCSVRRVSGRGAGAGLLQTPIKIARIIKTLSRALEVPVTAKIRLGWNEESRNYLLISRIIQENGGKLVAVHGRTRSQGYGGKADWDAIAEVKQNLSIPVIANGDVYTLDDIEKIKMQTGCDAVMIGRGAIGNPWIFAGMDRDQVPLELVQSTMMQHLESMLDFYGKEKGLLLFRKHANRYLRLSTLPRQERIKLLTIDEPKQFIQELNSLIY